MTKAPHDKKLSPRVRILFGEATALGPGKAELLEAISETGSISGAARGMSMSYRRAWNLVDSMNNEFKEPLVITVAGGCSGGGAEITETGREVLERYREIEAKATASVQSEISDFSKFIAKRRAVKSG